MPVRPVKENVSFNRIAPFYDGLARLVFGNAIHDSHHAFLDLVPPRAKVLVLGGGTGAFLPQFLTEHPEIQVYFIDSSSVMISKARRRIKPVEKVTFITGTENDLPGEILFDAVITFYYLDLFNDTELPGILDRITRVLKPNAIWLAADFNNNGKWWQGPFLTFMYLFFRFSAGLKTKRLPDWKKHLETAGIVCLRHKAFFSGFIESRCYCAGMLLP